MLTVMQEVYSLRKFIQYHIPMVDRNGNDKNVPALKYILQEQIASFNFEMYFMTTRSKSPFSKTALRKMHP